MSACRTMLREGRCGLRHRTRIRFAGCGCEVTCGLASSEALLHKTSRVDAAMKKARMSAIAERIPATSPSRRPSHHVGLRPPSTSPPRMHPPCRPGKLEESGRTRASGHVSDAGSLAIFQLNRTSCSSSLRSALVVNTHVVTGSALGVGDD
jgi:hypothetical protein